MPESAEVSPKEGPLLWGLRIAVAALFLGIAIWGVRTFSNDLRAEIITFQGHLQSRGGDKLGAQTEIRKALRLDPGDPQIKFQLALALVQYENRKAISGNERNFNFNNLERAFEHLSEAHSGIMRPSGTNFYMAQTTGMIARFAGRAGRRDLADRYAELSQAQYLRYRYEQGFPLADRANFYVGAIEETHSIGRSDLALTFWDDFRYIEKESSEEAARLDRIVVNSYYRLGEFHHLFSKIADALLKNPDYNAFYQDLYRYAQQTGDKDSARRILQMLEEAGDLPPAIQPMIEEFS